MWLDRWKTRRALRRKAIPDALWDDAIGTLTFLQTPSAPEQTRLRTLSSLFLDQKEFTGANGLAVTDRMAVFVATQACLPLLHIAPPDQPWLALAWYDDFVGIVIQPGESIARRTSQDETGIVHHYSEVIEGEAMEHGPVMLNWHDVEHAGDDDYIADSYNLVIHEFAHKIDMRNGPADGCPPLHNGFLGFHTAAPAYAHWKQAWTAAYEDFRHQAILHERFSAPEPWLDTYASTAPAEFFAVSCEAYFVNRTAYASQFPALVPLLDAFFRP